MSYITAFYSGIFGILLVVLSMRTIMLRRKLRVSIGDDNQPILTKAIRAQANFVEYVPLSLFLILLLELQGAWIHGWCITLLVGRVLHAWNLNRSEEDIRLRVIGMVLTFIVLIGTSLRLLVSYLAGLI